MRIIVGATGSTHEKVRPAILAPLPVLPAGHPQGDHIKPSTSTPLRGSSVDGIHPEDYGDIAGRTPSRNRSCGFSGATASAEGYSERVIFSTASLVLLALFSAASTASRASCKFCSTCVAFFSSFWEALTSFLASRRLCRVAFSAF